MPGAKQRKSKASTGKPKPGTGKTRPTQPQQPKQQLQMSKKDVDKIIKIQARHRGNLVRRGHFTGLEEMQSVMKGGKTPKNGEVNYKKDKDSVSKDKSPAETKAKALSASPKKSSASAAATPPEKTKAANPRSSKTKPQIKTPPGKRSSPMKPTNSVASPQELEVDSATPVVEKTLMGSYASLAGFASEASPPAAEEKPSNPAQDIQQLQHALKLISELEEYKQELDVSENTVQDGLNQALAELWQTKDAFQRSENRNSALYKDVSSLRATVSRLEAAVEAEQNQRRQEVNDVHLEARAALQSLRDQKKTVELERNDAKLRTSVLERDVAMLKEALGHAELDRAALNKENFVLRKRNEKLDESQTSLNGQVDIAKHELRQCQTLLNKEREMRMRALAEWETSEDKMSKQQHVRAEGYDKLHVEFVALQGAHKLIKDQLHGTMETLERKEDHVQELKEEIAEMKADMKANGKMGKLKLNMVAEAMREHMERMRQEMQWREEALQKHITMLTNQLGHARQTVAGLSKKLKLKEAKVGMAQLKQLDSEIAKLKEEQKDIKKKNMAYSAMGFEQSALAAQTALASAALQVAGVASKYDASRRGLDKGSKRTAPPARRTAKAGAKARGSPAKKKGGGGTRKKVVSFVDQDPDDLLPPRKTKQHAGGGGGNEEEIGLPPLAAIPSVEKMYDQYESLADQHIREAKRGGGFGGIGGMARPYSSPSAMMHTKRRQSPRFHYRDHMPASPPAANPFRKQQGGGGLSKAGGGIAGQGGNRAGLPGGAREELSDFSNLYGYEGYPGRASPQGGGYMGY